MQNSEVVGLSGRDFDPRTRILDRGPDAVTDAELLALCLRSGGPGQPIKRLVQGLLARFGGLGGLCRADPQDLLAIPGLGPAKASTLVAAAALATRAAAADLIRGELFNDSQRVGSYLRLEIGQMQQEVFACLFLDTRHRLLCFEKLFFGSVDRANVYPRELLKRALTYNAGAVILAHNHPSGVPEPSSSDIRLTSELGDLLRKIDVRLVDHLVVAGVRWVSMAERGLI